MNPHLNLFQSIGGALLALTVVVVIGWIAIARIRAWMRPADETDEGFTLADLRRLRREGAITEEEYERAHATMVAAVRNRPSGKEALPKKEPLPRAERRARDGAAPSVDGGRADDAPKQPRVRGLADGRLIIRDDPPAGDTDGPAAPPPRPINPTDPRTAPDA